MEDWSIIYETNKNCVAQAPPVYKEILQSEKPKEYTIIGLDDSLLYHINNTEVTSWDEEIMMLSYKSSSEPRETDNVPKTKFDRTRKYPESIRGLVCRTQGIEGKINNGAISIENIDSIANGSTLPENLEHKDIISYGLPAPFEFTTKDNLEFLEKIYIENNKDSFFEKDITTFASYEGTLIRVFNVESRESPLGDISDGDVIEAHKLNLKGEFKAHKWYISTNRKLHAKDSSWCCSTNFGDLFQLYLFQNLIKHDSSILRETIGNESVLSAYLNSLDREYEYIFLIKNNNQNRIVCRPNTFTKSNINKRGKRDEGFQDNELGKTCNDNCHCKHLNDMEEAMMNTIRGIPSISRDPSNLLFVCKIRKNGDISYDTSGLGVPFDTPERIPECYKFEEVLESVDDIDINKHQGVIMFVGHNIRTMTQYKIYNNAYKKLYDLRGNAVNVLWRLIEIIKQTYGHKEDTYNLGILFDDLTTEDIKDMSSSSDDDMYDDVELFYRLYYDTHESINSFIPKLRGIVGYIKSSYITRYIKKGYILVPKPFFKVMELCHAWHLEDKVNHKINEDIITDKMFEMETVNIFQMFKLYPDKLK